MVSAELTFAFVVFAIIRRQQPIWWFLSGVGIALVCLLLGVFAYGSRNWDRTPHLELRDRTIAFMPSKKMRAMGHPRAEAPFPPNAVLEYHVETGDRYFAGDRDQFLSGSFWIAEPNGTKQRLLNDVVGINLRTTATNLPKAEIAFRVLKVYDSETGEHVESDVTAQYTQTPNNGSTRTVFRILIATSNLTLGVIAATFFREIGPVVAIGVAGYFLVAIAAMYSKSSKRTALVQVAMLIPVYMAGYAFAVIAVWYLFRR